MSVNRPLYDDKNLQEKIDAITDKYGGEIFIVNGPELTLSSTLIRDRVKNNKTIRYLVPDEVNDYIIKNRLYMD